MADFLLPIVVRDEATYQLLALPDSMPVMAMPPKGGFCWLETSMLQAGDRIYTIGDEDMPVVMTCVLGPTIPQSVRGSDHVLPS